jgi:flagellar protein FliJ
MKKFRFNLEAVLKVKKVLEEKAQKDFSAVLIRRNLCLMQKNKLLFEIKELNEYQLELLAGNINYISQLLYQNRYQGLVNDLKLKDKELFEIETELENKRQVLIQTMKDRKVLEKLKEKKYQSYLEITNKEEQYFLDELAQFSNSRKKEIVFS